MLNTLVTIMSFDTLNYNTYILEIKRNFCE